MLITSKFHDYYDTAMGQGIDKTCVYERNPEKVDLTIRPQGGNNWRFFNEEGLNFYREERGEYYFRKRVIGFCGYMFPLVYVEKKWQPSNRLEVYYFYDANSLTKFMYDKGMLEKPNKWSSWRDYIDTEEGIKRFFDNAKYYKHFGSLFVEHKVPVFMVKGSDKRGVDFEVELNPKLSQEKFQTVKDPFSCFQEIYQYLSGVLGNTEKDITEVDDKIKAQQKGFDQYSFKTMKGDKKPRRKNRGKK